MLIVVSLQLQWWHSPSKKGGSIKRTTLEAKLRFPQDDLLTKNSKRRSRLNDKSLIRNLVLGEQFVGTKNIYPPNK